MNKNNFRKYDMNEKTHTYWVTSKFRSEPYFDKLLEYTMFFVPKL